MINLLTINFQENLIFMYAIMLTLGFVVTIGVSALCLSLKKIPLSDFRRSIYIIVPCSVLGASFFGKIGIYGNESWKLWEYFYFWKAGMSYFGGMFGAVISGSIFYFRVSNKRQISMLVYADNIIPNVLLGQAIGRWGNLFNHEILGKEVGNKMWKITWLPKWIWERLFYYIHPEDASIKYDNIIYREPLFLYESIACIIAWLLIMFFVGNFGKIFSNKPWKYDPISFPCKLNPKYKSVNESDLPHYSLQFPIKYKRDKNNKVYLSFSNVWNKSYYFYEPSKEEIEDAEQEYKKVDNKLDKDHKSYVKLKNEYKNLNKNSNNLIEYKKNLKKLRKEISRINYWKNVSSKKMTQIHNPNNYLIVRCGVKSGFYLLFYTLIRIFLETRRNPYEMFIKWSIGFNYSLFAFFIILSIVFIYLVQFVFPYKFRREGWLYEKSY